MHFRGLSLVPESPAAFVPSLGSDSGPCVLLPCCSLVFWRPLRLTVLWQGFLSSASERRGPRPPISSLVVGSDGNRRLKINYGELSTSGGYPQATGFRLALSGAHSRDLSYGAKNPPPQTGTGGDRFGRTVSLTTCRMSSPSPGLQGLGAGRSWPSMPDVQCGHRSGWSGTLCARVLGAGTAVSRCRSRSARSGSDVKGWRTTALPLVADCLRAWRRDRRGLIEFLAGCRSRPTGRVSAAVRCSSTGRWVWSRTALDVPAFPSAGHVQEREVPLGSAARLQRVGGPGREMRRLEHAGASAWWTGVARRAGRMAGETHGCTRGSCPAA
jgi:hypothetical protein